MRDKLESLENQKIFQPIKLTMKRIIIIIHLFTMLFVLALITSCNKNNEPLPEPTNSEEEANLNGTWVVLEWKEQEIDENSDTVLYLYSTYSNSVDELDTLWEVTATANIFNTQNETVIVNNSNFYLDEWQLDPNSTEWRYWIWVKKIDPVYGDIHFYMLGKRNTD